MQSTDYGGSGSGQITVDLEKAKAAAESMKANPPNEDDIRNDPQAFLASLGVQIDEQTLSTIKSKMSSSSGLGAEQAAIVHIDTG